MQIDMFGDEKAFLAKQRQAWGEAIKGNGAYCPCCDRKGKIHRYSLSEMHALALRWISINGTLENDGFVKMGRNAPACFNVAKTFSILQHWNLIEARIGHKNYWRATPKAFEFILGHITVPKAVYIYNKTIFGFDANEISFRQCFEVSFNFDEMMSSQFRWENIKGDENE
jgi:hypothetical protein